MAIPTRTLIQLASMGLSADQAEIVATMLRDVEEATKVEVGAPMEARRAADRKRKQDERERSVIASRHVTSAEITSVPVTSAPSAETPTETPPTVFPSEKGSPPSPPKGGSVPPQKARRRKPLGTLCPEDLQPQQGHFLKCEQRGAPRYVATRTAEKLINWSHANADRDIAWKSDWHKALHNMLDDEIEKWKRSPDANGPGHPGRPPPGQRLSGTTQAALSRRSEPTDAAPTLDLQPALRPFPGQRPEPAEPARGDERAASRDPARPDEGRTGQVHDLAARRAYG